MENNNYSFLLNDMNERIRLNDNKSFVFMIVNLIICVYIILNFKSVILIPNVNSDMSDYFDLLKYLSVISLILSILSILLLIISILTHSSNNRNKNIFNMNYIMKLNSYNFIYELNKSNQEALFLFMKSKIICYKKKVRTFNISIMFMVLSLLLGIGVGLML